MAQERVISVITPVHVGGDGFILETFESLASQKLPAGWSLEWVVQEDGRTGEPLRGVPDLPWVSKGNGRAGGAARARTVALPRARGSLVRTLDADDLLPDADVLARDIDVLLDRPGIGWCVSPCLDLLPNGELKEGPNDPAPGLLPDGFLLDSLIEGELPVMGTTMTAHTALVRAVGGWPAIPAFEDAATLLACEAVSSGWVQEQPGEIYRKHTSQSTASVEYHDPKERELRVRASIERALALRDTGWRWTPAENWWQLVARQAS
ncbi:GltA [Streptomyces sp. NBC_01187]|uniref:GltA n=1 Tax=Streptomyces sp. NBC_01187 TaxID=2903766 RepID=UPI003866D06F|nr:GltA [Streptomyces sp. NBC_01187]